MSAFESFVNLELPRRSPHLTVEIVSYDDDPNLVGAPADLKNAPKGTWYMRETPDVIWYRKEVSGAGGATSWVIPGGTGAGDIDGGSFGDTFENTSDIDGGPFV